MKDKEMMRNGSGYYDDTAYKAMTTNPKPGEIWMHNQSGAYMLVVANVNGVCPTLRLNEQMKEGCIPVMCRVPMYINPEFVGYVFESNLGKYVRSAKEEEFKAVKQGFADMLGIQSYAIGIEDPGPYVNVGIYNEKVNEVKALEEERTAQQNTINDLTKRNAELLEERDKLLEEIGGYGATIKRQSDELQENRITIIAQENEHKAAILGAQRSMVYKELYESLLDKVISVRGCV